MTAAVTIADCRRAGYCVRGSKRRCAALGLDFRALITVGLSVEELEKLGDEDVNRCIASARARIARESEIVAR